MFRNNLAPIVELLVNSLSGNEQMAQYISYSSFIREYRTVELRVPRQTGKTTILLNKLLDEPTIMFVHGSVERDRVRSFAHIVGADVHARTELDQIDRIKSRYFGRTNIKYERLLVDEPAFYTRAQEDSLQEFIEFLHGRQLVTDNFYVLKLGT